MPTWAGTQVDSGPLQYAKPVTPSDATNFTFGYCRALLVGGVGNVTAIMKDEAGADLAVLFTAVAAGTILPICCKRVNTTGTTATLMTAMW